MNWKLWPFGRERKSQEPQRPTQAELELRVRRARQWLDEACNGGWSSTADAERELQAALVALMEV